MFNAAKEGYSDKWITPQEILEPLRNEFGPLWDPCPIDWKEGDTDALAIPWQPRTFCNPPYSRVAEFVKKATQEQDAGNTVVMLVIAAVDTRWFHDLIWQRPGVELRFPRGRIKFINPRDPEKRVPCPRPSMLVIFRPVATAQPAQNNAHPYGTTGHSAQ